LRHRLVLSAALALAEPAALLAQEFALEVAPFPALAEARRVVGLVEDVDDRLWCAFENRVEWHDADGVFQLSWQGQDERGSRTLRDLATGPDGTLWISSSTKLWFVLPGTHEALPFPDERTNGAWQVAVDSVGTAWVRTTTGLIGCRVDGSTIPTALPDDVAPANGVTTFGGRIWAWNGTGLWQAPAGETPPRWRAMPGAPPRIRRIVCAEGKILAVTEESVQIAAEDAPETWRTVHAGDELQSVSFVTYCAGAFWFASHTRMWRLALNDGSLMPVRVFLNGAPPADKSIYALEGDRQGLLWIATQSGICRAGVVPGVDNLLVPQLDGEESIVAFAELPSGHAILAGMFGTLLESTDDGWTSLGPPWPTGNKKRTRIESLGVDRRGDLWVTTRAKGVWHRRGTTWQCLGEERGIEGARSWLQTNDGSIWLAGVSEAWRIDANDDLHEVAIHRPREKVDPRPSVLAADAKGTVWLGTFREALMRYDSDADCFRSVAMEGLGSSVLGLYPSTIDPIRMWALTTNGLHSIDTVDGRATTVQGAAHNGLMRSLAQCADGALWVTTPQRLAFVDPKTGQSMTLPPRLGAHPLGYTFRANLRRSDGETWLGAQPHATFRGLAGRAASLGPLDAVVDGVADRVRQRVLDRLDDRLVQLGVAALHLDPRALAAAHRQVAHHPRQLAPDAADRLHAGLHHPFLQLRGHEVEPLAAAQKGRILLRRRVLQDLVAREHQLADEVHQRVEQRDVDADRIAGHGRSRGRRRARRCRRGLARARRELLGFGGLLRLLGQRRERGDEFGVVAVPFPLLLLEPLEHLADRVRHRQQRAGDGSRHVPLAVADQAQQVLAGVGDRAELVERQEPAGPLDRVDRAEHLPQHFGCVRRLLERHKVAIQLVESLVGLDQELL